MSDHVASRVNGQFQRINLITQMQTRRAKVVGCEFQGFEGPDNPSMQNMATPLKRKIDEPSVITK